MRLLEDTLHLSTRHTTGGSGRAQGHTMEYLCRVDVPDAGDEPLVEQELLDADTTAGRRRAQGLGAQVGRECVRPDVAQQHGSLRGAGVDDLEPTETAGVDIEQRAAAAEISDQVGVGWSGCTFVDEQRLTAHAKMDGDGVAVFKVKPHYLAPSPATDDPTADNCVSERLRRAEDHTGVNNAQSMYGAATQVCVEVSADRLNFGEFWHGLAA